jgi:hypothetical protein
MRKRTAVTIFVAVACVTATGAVAAQPSDPGCFGSGRAAWAVENGSAGNELPGVGYYASTRAGDNGAMNQTYKDSCGGTP